MNKNSFVILDKFLSASGGDILEIGPAQFEHTLVIHDNLNIKNIDICDPYPQLDLKPSFIRELYLGIDLIPDTIKYDCLWCSHVLEHVFDVHQFLSKVYHVLKEGGTLGVVVPPFKPNLVGGHINLFTSLTLVYNLVIAGFDCSNPIDFGQLGYNNYIILNKKPNNIQLNQLVSGKSDIELLSRFFPYPVAQNEMPRF